MIALLRTGKTKMQSEAHPGTARAPRKGSFARALIRSMIAIAATVLAAIAVVLPWGLRIKYSALLRWFRNLLMQNVRAVRTWALRKRWEWDSAEADTTQR